MAFGITEWRTNSVRGSDQQVLLDAEVKVGIEVFIRRE